MEGRYIKKQQQIRYKICKNKEGENGNGKIMTWQNIWVIFSFKLYLLSSCFSNEV